MAARAVLHNLARHERTASTDSVRLTTWHQHSSRSARGRNIATYLGDVDHQRGQVEALGNFTAAIATPDFPSVVCQPGLFPMSETYGRYSKACKPNGGAAVSSTPQSGCR